MPCLQACTLDVAELTPPSIGTRYPDPGRVDVASGSGAGRAAAGCDNVT